MESRYFNEETNSIYIYGEIDYLMANEITDFLATAEVVAVGDLLYYKPLTVYISSYGGDASHTMTIFQLLENYKESGGHVTTVALGACCSGGAFLFLAGNTRIVSNYCYFMLHKGIFSYGSEQVANIELDLKHWDSIINNYLEAVLTDTKLTKKQLDDKWNGRDWIIKPQTMMKLGLAH